MNITLCPPSSSHPVNVQGGPDANNTREVISSYLSPHWATACCVRWFTWISSRFRWVTIHPAGASRERLVTFLFLWLTWVRPSTQGASVIEQEAGGCNIDAATDWSIHGITSTIARKTGPYGHQEI
ncbi:hypothetical protein B0O80DRAFT_486220 [Mortierella sp. GBAus27b]|nr:hypothetical protein B0O80DRAFT_486220 [Mortierella sp. GBAus27b]